jgi:hypothetical protein
MYRYRYVDINIDILIKIFLFMHTYIHTYIHAHLRIYYINIRISLYTGIHRNARLITGHRTGVMHSYLLVFTQKHSSPAQRLGIDVYMYMYMHIQIQMCVYV